MHALLLDINPDKMAGLVGSITFYVLVGIGVLWAIRKVLKSEKK